MTATKLTTLKHILAESLCEKLPIMLLETSFCCNNINLDSRSAASQKTKKTNIYKQDSHRLIVVVNNIVVKNSSLNVCSCV
jgi:hypothetical protein